MATAARQAYNKRHYQANKAYYIEKSARRKAELLKWVDDYKTHLGCSHCPENHPACLVFHHRDPTEKDINICDAILAGWSKVRLLAEITKCDVLCSNCHMKLHYEERRRGEMDITRPSEGRSAGSIPAAGTVVGATVGELHAAVNRGFVGSIPTDHPERTS